MINTETLLDKLYNLRGSDSEILKEMDRQKVKAEETRDRTTEEKGKLQTDIAEFKKQREELEEQGEKFKELLQGIHKEDFATVLTRLRIDFDPSTILEKVEKNLPKTIETVEKDTKKAEDELVKVEQEMNEAITTIDELGIRKDTALANQAKLNEYFDLALEGRINITRDSITSLLSEFGFNDEEQRETAKLLMFPEDALFAYDKKVSKKAKGGKSISEVMEEAKTIAPIEQPSVTVDSIQEQVEEKIMEVSAKDKLIQLLKDEGIDYLDYTSNEITMLVDSFDAEQIKANIEYIKEKGLDMDIFINHASMMLDKELKDKIELLLSIGKDKLDLYLNPSVLIKYDLNTLKNIIVTIKENQMDPKDVPLMAY